MHFRTGTVGRLLDQIQYRLEAVPGIEEGGRLFVKGPNIMLGYLRADNPGVLETPPEGWYDTGDIVKVNEDGYLTILGRAKRFAKIAGEMISLALVEAKLAQALPDAQHAVVSVPDAKKGEQLVMFTTDEAIDARKVADALKLLATPALLVPRTVIAMKELPLLGSGKTDYQTLNRMAREQVKP
jgi:acyl-[acyl-carrier-protein]-phospholipid O-acyltransferase/long-chain-fatty-acid--[acyl-carrier-protein] ligase